MDSMVDRLNKLREERLAREKARIEKLREMNLKKYNKNDDHQKLSITVKSETNVKNNHPSVIKNNFHVNSAWKRPTSAPTKQPNTANVATKPKAPINSVKTLNKVATNITKNNQQKLTSNIQKQNVETKVTSPDENIKKNTTSLIPVASDSTKPNVSVNGDIPNNGRKQTNQDKKAPLKVAFNKSANLRKSLAVSDKTAKPSTARKTMLVRPTPSASKDNRESVFDRLYKPKPVQKTQSNDIQKLHTDPNYLKKVIHTTGIILNKRHTVFDTQPKIAVPVRRSISAVHFKRISKQEINHCIHKWSSIGDKLNNVHLKHINEDDTVKEDKVISAIKSERKKVKFQTPMSNFNTPRPEELQSRLESWLQKRGKSLDAYQHLQCFGINHLPHRLNFEKLYNEENKENIAVESDSDDGSYTENMNDEASTGTEKWRTASLISDSDDLNDTQDTTLTCSDVVNIQETLLGALNDLAELLREGFDWEQSARWLRAIRERFPSAPNTAAYWECRAALEERRGDLPASVQCWEEAIAKGTEHSVVEENLDQLLDKFMQLKISPNSGKRRQADPKLVDVKNVFKSTIIRFAMQQAKIRQSNQMGTPKFTVTPVRRSGRLSRNRTPLQDFIQTIRQADQTITGEDVVFVPNKNLCETP